jgi:MSHA biogenesis protein MshI
VQTDLKPLAQQLGNKPYPVLGLLSRNEYQMFLVDKAVVRPEEMLQSLRWTLSPLLDYPPEEANLAWMDVPIKNKLATTIHKMHVVAAKRRLVEQRARWFDQARLGLSVMDVRETSQANLAQCLETPASGVCLIYADALGLQITITHHGDLYLERFIRESLFDPVDATAPDTRSVKFDRVALEVQRSLDFVRRNVPGIEVDLLVVGPTQEDIGLQQALSTRMLEPLRAFDLGQVFDWPKDSDLVKPEVQAQYFNALGASLRPSASH